VTDQDYRQVAEGEFTLATESERRQLDELKALAASGDRADRLSAALAYRRLAAFAEAIAAYEGLAREVPDEPAFRQALADLYRIAGRPKGEEAATSGKKSSPE
jgi:predicted Zn-dependent protease